MVGETVKYEEMDDAALVRLAATQVMKWTVFQNPHGNTVAQPSPPADIEDRVCLEHVHGVSPARMWNPLDSDAAALELVDAIDPTDFSLEKSGGNWTADFGAQWVYTHTDRRRAIVIAALLATEVRA